MDLSLIIPAFIAGILTFLAPCTLPLAPAYLGFISGTSAGDLKDPKKAPQAKRKIFINGIFFVTGFSVVFIALGTLAGLVGSALVPYRIWLTRIGGVFVIIFGLYMIGLLKISFFNIEKRMKIPSALKQGKLFTSFVLGSSFGLGWTPCVGPILGTILLLASTSATALQGGFLLFIFSLGLAIPFLLLALAVGVASKYIARFSKYLHFVEIIGGIFLIFIGILLVSNRFTLLISWGYRLFEFINYDALLNYL